MAGLRTIVTVALFVLSGASQNAYAQSEFREFFGNWIAYSATTNQNRRLCGINTTAGNFQFHVKYFNGERNFTIQIFNTGWRIPRGTRIRFRFFIDNFEPYFTDGGFGSNDLIEATISEDVARRFWNEFRIGNALHIVFLDGNEPGRSFSLRGSSAATDRMSRCIQSLAAPTQPFNPTQPTQPLSPTQPAPQPTQPLDPGRGRSEPSPPPRPNPPQPNPARTQPETPLI